MHTYCNQIMSLCTANCNIMQINIHKLEILQTFGIIIELYNPTLTAISQREIAAS